MARKRRRFSTPQIVSIAIICLCTITIAIAVVLSIVFRPENVVKSQISDLVSDYYENYLYESFDFDNASSENIAKFMDQYEKNGLTPIRLRQIFLHNRHKKDLDTSMIEKYCDDENTKFKIYPEYPYSKTSYRVEYTYSCEF